MKKYLNVFLVLGLISSFIGQVFASGAIAGATEITQLLNNGELLGVNVSSGATAISSNISAVDATIGRPLVTMMINTAQQKAAKDIVSWANGGFKGDPLIISDPGKYIGDAALAQVKLGLGSLPKNSPYSDSIFNSLVGQYKDSEDLGAKINSITQSNIPSLVQKNFCTDSSLTENAVASLGGDMASIDPKALQQKKKELKDYACNGNPNTDQKLAARLTDIQSQNASVGGWDSWLAKTGGDNAYTKKVLATNEINAKAAAEKDKAQKEIYQGAGPVSQTKCLKTSTVTKTGETPICEPGQKVTLTPGKTVASSLDRSANSGIDRLTRLQGEGLAAFIMEKAMSSLVSGLNSAFNGSQGGSSSGSNNNQTTTVTSKSPPTQDLAGDEDTKTAITSPVFKMLENSQSTFDSLESVDTEYLAEVNTYATKIASGKSCYDSLIENKTVTPDNPQVVAAYSFYEDRQNRIDIVKSALTQELKKLANATQLITTTKTKLKETNSSEEINTLYNNYTKEVEKGEYPTIETLGKRKGEYSKTKADIKNDKDVDTYQTTCNQMGGNSNDNGGAGGA